MRRGQVAVFEKTPLVELQESVPVSSGLLLGFIFSKYSILLSFIVKLSR